MAITEEDVHGIIEIDETITSLVPFMTAANMLLMGALAEIEYTSYSTDEYDEIHKWLTAHFVAVRDNRRSSETADEVREEFQYNVGRGLQCTMYGQTAMMLDYSGALAHIDKANTTGGSKKIQCFWAGKDLSQ